jgi:hypothetical protein
MNARRSAVAVLGLLLLAVASSTSWAQFNCQLNGTVTDPSGAVVPNATVTVTNVATGVARTAETSSSGTYIISALPPGTFDVSVTATGFRTEVQRGVTLSVALPVTLNMTLQLGTATQQVSVTAAPPPVETTEARVSAQIGEQSVKNLPLVGRNFFTLVVLTPGVTGLPSGGGQSYAQATSDIFNAEYGVNLNANGQRAESNSFLVDSGSVNGSPRGGVTNLTPNADSVQELRVSVNDFSAQYGRNSSAVTNIATKSGTNQFHGTVGYFYTGNTITAANVFQNGCIRRLDGSCNRLPVFRRNEGNWSFGGPIRKDKTFFFASMDFLRSGVGDTFVTSVVSPQFINYLGQNYPNSTAYKVTSSYPPAAILGATQITPGSLEPNKCSGLAPSASITTAIGVLPCNFPLTNAATFSSTIPRNGLQWNVRIDDTFHDDKDRIYGNWYRTSRQTVTFATPSVYPAFTGNEPEYTEYFNFDYTHIFSPTLLLESAVTVTRARGDVQVANGQIPNINVPGIASYGMGFSGPTFIQTNGEWRNVLTWNRGRHQFKFGGNYGHDDGWGSGAQFGPNFTRYYYNFAPFAANGNIPALYDFALDTPFSESNYGYNPQTAGQFGPSFLPVFPRFSVWGNDEFKLKPNMTLSWGIRWEVFLVPYEQHKPVPEETNMAFPSGSNFQERVTNGVMKLAPFWNGADYRSVAPRIGLAWDPTHTGKMSIRTGVGMFYDRPAGQLIHDCCTTLPLFATISVSQQTAIKPVYGLGTLKAPPWGFPALPGLTPGLNSQGGLIDAAGNPVPSDINSVQQPNFGTQRSVNWFFGIQYALRNNWTIEGNYVGSAGRHFYQNYDINRWDGNLIATGGRLTRLNPAFASILYAQTNGNAAYNGANVSVKKRFSSGLQFQAGYTFGKAIDYASTFGNNLNIVDIYHLNTQRGLSDYNVGQKFGASFVYAFPTPKASGAKSALLGGWQAASVIILQSGSPWSPVCTTPFSPIKNAAGQVIGNAGCDFNADGFNYDHPNAPASGNFKAGGNQAFLKGIIPASAFTVPALGQDGTLGRNTFVGPGYADVDLSAFKNTKIPWFWGSEGATFQFRADFFNLFNRTNLQNPNSTLPAPVLQGGSYVFPDNTNFGQSTSSYPARNIQFGLKIIF